MYVEIILGIVCLIGSLYFYMTKNFDYWTKRGVYQIKPHFPFGTMSGIFSQSQHLNDIVLKDHLETKDLPFYGAYFLRAPILFLKDVDLIKQVTIKDFEYFVDRNPSNFQHIRKTNQLADEIMMEQMTSAEGEQWKSIRSTFTPIFTSGSVNKVVKLHNEANNL